MTVRSVVLVLLSILAAIFLILNWQGIMAPVPVNFIFGEVEAPLALILLVVLGVLWVVGIAWSLMSQASTLLEIRRAYKEANANKTLANHAELSRTEQMKKTLQEEMSGMQEKIIAELKTIASETGASVKTSDARIAALEESVKVLTARFDKLAQEAGSDLNPVSPSEHKRGFFGGLFAGSEKEKKPEKAIEFNKPAAAAAAPKVLEAPEEVKKSSETPAVEAKAQASEPAATAAPESTETAGDATGAKKKGFLGKIFH